MLYTVSKTFEFSASHELRGLEMGHPCSRMHGHNYTVELRLHSTELDAVGMVVDFRKMKKFGQWVDRLDHKCLNEIPEVGVDFNPTTENLAEYFFEIARDIFPLQVSAVRVSEGRTTWAEVTWS